ncbi:MAG: DNA-protecting protein DprA [Deltaproteobacteria bacterium]|nr:DNA-protecting protein DprA [Deltaproteobacteria bacterium]
MDSTRDWLTLHLVPGLGAMGCRTLIEMFGGPAKVLAADSKALAQAPGIHRKVIELITARPPYREAEVEQERTREYGVDVISWDNPAYPEALRTIYNPPMLLFVKGDASQLNRPAIAVVGSRAATSYGLKIARRLGAELAGHGLTVVSGLALGIDAGAHAGALEAHGSTVAVVGCGVDVSYPRRNMSLASRIVGSGAVISEYSMGTQPDAFRFPARNRIISGLSLGVVVVEAATRSGSLITARLAMEEGREVFAVPGRVDSSKSAGTHKLLQDGAKLVYRVEDIFEELSVPLANFAVATPKETKIPALSELDATGVKIMAVLDEYPQHFEIIINKSGLGAQKAAEVLLLLELQGLVESLPGQQYRAKNVAA